MEILINNDERMFQVISKVSGKQWFGNLKHLNQICQPLPVGTYRIYHFWNNRPAKVTAKFLREMFEAQEITQTFQFKPHKY